MAPTAANPARVAFEKIVLVTRKTRLAELIERFNTRPQARFYIEHAGGNFSEYEHEDNAYRQSLDAVRRSVECGLKIQVLDRDLVPTYTFLPEDLVVTLGQDGLVANVAKYVHGCPIVAINPDPVRFDGILLPFLPEKAASAVVRVIEGRWRGRAVTLAEAHLSDGQVMLAFNDLFIGACSHVSARYRLKWKTHEEAQSSSGVLVSTGAGSTGWMSSVFQMASGVAALAGARGVKPVRINWEDKRLLFVVREPFVSKHSQAGLVAGMIESGESLQIESRMPSGGVIFSDGMESDFISFNSGVGATIHAARETANLVVG